MQYGIGATCYENINAIIVFLEAVLKLETLPTKVWVIDNSYILNRPEEHIREFNRLKIQLNWIHCPENIGVEGAITRILELAMQNKDLEFLWLFDQDSKPKPDSIIELIKAWQTENNRLIYAIISSAIERVGNWAGNAGFDKNMKPFSPQPSVSHEKVLEVEFTITAGMSLWLPFFQNRPLTYTRGYFLDYFDFELCRWTKSKGGKIGMCLSSKIEHFMGAPSMQKFIGLVEVRVSGYNSIRWYYLTRNRTHFAIQKHSIIDFFCSFIMLKTPLKEALVTKNHRLFAFALIGFLHAVSGKLGKLKSGSFAN